MALRGYTPLGGTSRKYRTPGGKIISRREYDNRRAKQAGFRNRYELEKYRESLQRGRWGDFIYDIRQHTGRQPDWSVYADIREVRARRAELKRNYPDLGGQDRDSRDSKLVAADGPLARILDASGRRPMSGRPVGDS